MASNAWKVLSNTLGDVAQVLPTPARTAVGLMGKLAIRTYNVMEAKEMSKTNQQLVVQLAERSLIVSRMIELYLAERRPQDKVFNAFVSNLSATIKDVLEFVEKFVQQRWIDRLLSGNEVKSEFKSLWRRLDALTDDYRVYLLHNMASKGPSERIEHPQLREFWNQSMNNVLEAKWAHFWDSFLHVFPDVRQFLSGPLASTYKAELQARAQPRFAKLVGPWEINNIFQPPNSSVEQIISTALVVKVAKATETPSKICTRAVHWWTGYWIRDSHKGVMTVELLVAANNRIYGGGSDEIGEFTCTGEWRGTKVHFIKHYIGLHQVEYAGAISTSNTIIDGMWTTRWTKGRDLSTWGSFLLQQESPEESSNSVVNGREAGILKVGEVQRWTGYYKHCQGGATCNMSADIVFTQTHKIYGCGVDPVGRFSLSGRYHSTSHSILMSINKQYEGKHILYMGAVSHSLSVEQEDLKVVMEGSWVINTTGLAHNVDHGRFCLHPEVDD